ncbi:Processive diacylglycerol beta-glucosyltransferase [compost metagenome]
MLFHKPLPGQEEENSHYFTSQGWGTPISSLDDISTWMKRLMENYDEVVTSRERVLDHIASYYPLQSAQAIIDLLDNNYNG